MDTVVHYGGTNKVVYCRVRAVFPDYTQSGCRVAEVDRIGIVRTGRRVERCFLWFSLELCFRIRTSVHWTGFLFLLSFGDLRAAERKADLADIGNSAHGLMIASIRRRRQWGWGLLALDRLKYQ